jgi:hypothetical protein
MAKTRPPKETMLPAAAPVDSGAEPLLVALPATPEVADSSEEAVGLELELETAAEPVAEAVEFPPTMGVTKEPLGATGVAVGTTTTEVTEAVSVTAIVEVMSATELAAEVTPAGTETSDGEGRGTAEPTALVAGGAWI